MFALVLFLPPINHHSHHAENSSLGFGKRRSQNANLFCLRWAPLTSRGAAALPRPSAPVSSPTKYIYSFYWISVVVSREDNHFSSIISENHLINISEHFRDILSAKLCFFFSFLFGGFGQFSAKQSSLCLLYLSTYFFSSWHIIAFTKFWETGPYKKRGAPCNCKYNFEAQANYQGFSRDTRKFSSSCSNRNTPSWYFVLLTWNDAVKSALRM